MTPEPAPYGADLPIIARLRDEQVEFWYGGEATVGPLLAALDAANAEVLRLREVLREITEDPDGRTGRGCLDLHEARHIARAALLPAPTEGADR